MTGMFAHPLLDLAALLRNLLNDFPIEPELRTQLQPIAGLAYGGAGPYRFGSRAFEGVGARSTAMAMRTARRRGRNAGRGPRQRFDLERAARPRVPRIRA